MVHAMCHLQSSFQPTTTSSLLYLTEYSVTLKQWDKDLNYAGRANVYNSLHESSKVHSYKTAWVLYPIINVRKTTTIPSILQFLKFEKLGIGSALTVPINDFTNNLPYYYAYVPASNPGTLLLKSQLLKRQYQNSFSLLLGICCGIKFWDTFTTITVIKVPLSKFISRTQRLKY